MQKSPELYKNQSMTMTHTIKTRANIQQAFVVISVLIAFQSLLMADIGDTWDGSAEGQVSTGVMTGGTYFNLPAFLGATSYYSNGITGQGTVATVLESGLVWNGHETLSHLTATNYSYASGTYGGTNMEQKFDRHATWVGMVIGGRGATNAIQQNGLAYGTTLNSASIATSWSGTAYTLAFNFNYATWIHGMTNSFGNSDVVNQSFGFTDQPGTNVYTRMVDAIALVNNKTLSVVSAGNSGPGSNTVGGPGSGYNSITVGAMSSANTYTSIASFSSRGPQDWGYRKWLGGVTYSNVVVSNVRAPVDITAPGASILTAFYGGQTGGNNPTLTGSTNGGTSTNTFSSVNGTSFAAPLVSGGAALMMSAAKTLPALSNNNEATESMVIKALLMNGATKPTGWSNGQTTISGVVTTTQALDYRMGTGMMNLDRSYTNQVLGQTGVDGKGTGDLGIVQSTGWDHGAMLLGGTNSYLMGGMFSTSSITTTLSWFRQVQTVIGGSANAVDIAQANLDLQVWSLNPDGSLNQLVGVSRSFYDTSEHLSFQLPTNGYYGVAVTFSNNTFDNFNSWGTGSNAQTYGLAWLTDSSRNWDNVYWQGTGAWATNGGTNMWNSSVSGAGSGIGFTASTVNAAIHGGFTNVTVDGKQFVRGLSLSPSNSSLTVAGTNSAGIRIGSGGITMESGASGDAAISSNVGVEVSGNQQWRNQSTRELSVGGQVTGSGTLLISSTTPQGRVTLSGAVNHQGGLESAGSGKTSLLGDSGANVTSIRQTGSGELVMGSGSQHLTETLQVTSGTLTVNGNLAGNSLLTVSGGQLRGGGNLGAVTVQGAGILSPGNGVGNMTFTGQLTLTPSSNINWQIQDAISAWDLMTFTGGNLDLSGLGVGNEVNINLWSVTSTSPESFNSPSEYNGEVSNFNQNQAYNWEIITSDAPITGFNASKFIINTGSNAGTGGFANLHNAGGFNLSISGDNQSIFLNYSPVPEPTPFWSLVLLAGAMALARFMKRQRQSSRY